MGEQNMHKNLKKIENNELVPSWLFESLVEVDKKKLKEEDAISFILDSKNDYIQEFNQSNPTYKKNRRSKLDFKDIAVVIAYFHSFYNIAPTGADIDDNELYMYLPERGLYTNDETHIMRVIDDLTYDANIKSPSTMRKKIARRISYIVPSMHKQKYPNRIPLKNGLYNTETNELEPFDASVVITNKIGTKYIENPKSNELTKDFDVWFENATNKDENTKELMLQIMHYAILQTREELFGIIFYNEKGTVNNDLFIKLLKRLISEDGYGYISRLNMRDFEKSVLVSRFLNSTLTVGDNVGYERNIDMNRHYRSTIMRNPIYVNRWRKQPISMRYGSANIQVFNLLPFVENLDDPLLDNCLFVSLSDIGLDDDRYDTLYRKAENKTLHEHILHKVLNTSFNNFKEFEKGYPNYDK